MCQYESLSPVSEARLTVLQSPLPLDPKSNIRPKGDEGGGDGKRQRDADDIPSRYRFWVSKIRYLSVRG